MPASQVFFSLMWLCAGSVAEVDNPGAATVYQEGRFASAKTGDGITLRCFIESDVAVRYYWYKQALGQKPRLVSTFYKYQADATFHNEFTNSSRFSVDADKGKNHLTISDVQLTDAATYFCASGYSYKLEIAEGTVVDVKGSEAEVQASVQQSESETVQPGGSLTLNCTVRPGSCEGNVSVYWFKNAGEPHGGIIYTHGDGDSRCEKEPGVAAHSCVYRLPITSLNQSHSGTYYCAVALCGRVVFGGGTTLNGPPSPAGDMNSFALLCVLSGTLAFSTIVLVFFVCVIEKIKAVLQGSCGRARSDPSSWSVKDKMNKHTLCYTAGRKDKVKRFRGQTDDTWSECVFSRVK